MNRKGGDNNKMLNDYKIYINMPLKIDIASRRGNGVRSGTESIEDEEVGITHTIRDGKYRELTQYN